MNKQTRPYIYHAYVCSVPTKLSLHVGYSKNKQGMYYGKAILKIEGDIIKTSGLRWTYFNDAEGAKQAAYRLLGQVCADMPIGGISFGSHDELKEWFFQAVRSNDHSY